jgi:two-component system, OmpR family, alkaline phosphatase synthesis response regulator PhoP
MSYRIAVIEDDPEISRIEELALRKEGYEVSLYPTGRAFLDSLKKGKPEMMILDLMLPDIQGLDLLKEVRQDKANEDVSIMIVSAKGLISDKVEGLDFGADDYLEKPFSVLELASRVNAHFRRRKDGSSVFPFQGFSLNGKAHILRDPSGHEVALTPKEWDLLMIFVQNPHEALSREALFNKLWGQGEFESRALDVHIVSLRKKLHDPDGRLIETIYVFGYRFNL